MHAKPHADYPGGQIALLCDSIAHYLTLIKAPGSPFAGTLEETGNLTETFDGLTAALTGELRARWEADPTADPDKLTNEIGKGFAHPLREAIGMMTELVQHVENDGFMRPAPHLAAGLALTLATVCHGMVTVATLSRLAGGGALRPGGTRRPNPGMN